MQIPERPSNEESSDDGAPSYEWIDEWLCEYVDGTMDPSLEAVFEQYVEANPELKAHVQRLQQTRELLGGCRDVPDAPEPQPEVSEEVERDLLQTSASLPEQARKHPAVATGLVASIAVALVVGFLAGSMLVRPAPFSPTTTVSAVDGTSGAQQTVQANVPSSPERAPSSQQSQTSSFVTGEPIPPHPVSAPLSGPDTAGTSSIRTTVGER